MFQFSLRGIVRVLGSWNLLHIALELYENEVTCGKDLQLTLTVFTNLTTFLNCCSFFSAFDMFKGRLKAFSLSSNNFQFP